MSNGPNKGDKRSAAIIVLIVVVILLLLWRRARKGKSHTTIIDRGGAFGMPEIGPGGQWVINTGDNSVNIGPINLPDFRPDYQQQSSCGCSTSVEIVGAQGPVYYAPAKVRAAPVTNVQYTTLVMPPPKPLRLNTLSAA